MTCTTNMLFPPEIHSVPVAALYDKRKSTKNRTVEPIALIGFSLCVGLGRCCVCCARPFSFRVRTRRAESDAFSMRHKTDGRIRSRNHGLGSRQVNRDRLYDRHMFLSLELQTIGLLALGLGVISAIARGFWLYQAALTWPTANGVITRIDIERRRDGGQNGGHYFCATFSYDFRDPARNLRHGSWYKNFSSEEEARQFSERELPMGGPVVVRFNPKNPTLNNLELDSWTYIGDRPTTLSPK